MKLLIAHFTHESHSFSPLPTAMQSYRDGFLYLPSEGQACSDEDFADDMRLISLARERGHEVCVGLIAAATPSAPTNRGDYETLRDELLANLRAALPVDAVLLFLHGAQMAQGYADCEGDILEQVRTIVGEEVPIGVELDLHCNLSARMLENATVIIPCKEYPHTDFAERAGELLDIIERTVAGECRPVMTTARVPMLGIFHTTREPMRGLVDKIIGLEGRDGILSISIAHGFPYGDSADTGANILVVSDGVSDHARRLVADLGQELFAMREQIAAPVVSVEAALDAALACSEAPVLIADTSDNPGGGAAGDSTFILREMIKRNVDNAAVAMFWDPIAVATASKAGVGARLPLRLGGKIGPLSGEPLDLDVTVIAARNDARQMVFGRQEPLGDAVVVRHAGIDIVINSRREQVHDPACFTELGVDPWRKRVLVVKSAQHFYARFAERSAKIIYAAPPGTVTSDYHSLPYQHLPRPIWPLDATPFTAFGRDWA